LPAQYAGVSGVLAVVTAGIYANRFTPRVVTPAARTQVIGFWDTVVFVADATLFLVVGLQLHGVALAAFAADSWPLVIGYALAVNAVLIVVRIGLTLLAEYAPTAAPADHAAPDWKHALVVAWSGFRGAVSLAAALAIPLRLPGGMPFPHRDLIIFLTFSAILVTLVLGGFTLPPVVRRLHIAPGDEERDEIREAMVRSSDAALARIAELERDGQIDQVDADLMRRKFEHRREIQRSSRREGSMAHLARHAAAEREVIAAQRQAVIEMREHGEIDNAVQRQILTDLDMSGARSDLDAELTE
jgi:CPA1 family monovalent cation:H+ antiporter